MITEKAIARTKFPGMKAGDTAEHYVTNVATETGGDAIFKAGGRGWSGSKGGKRAVVEAVTVRNLCAHGIPVFNQKAINRITMAAGRDIVLKHGDPIKLDEKRFTAYTATPRAFARLMADGVTSLPDSPQSI